MEKTSVGTFTPLGSACMPATARSKTTRSAIVVESPGALVPATIGATSAALCYRDPNVTLPIRPRASKTASAI